MQRDPALVSLLQTSVNFGGLPVAEAQDALSRGKEIEINYNPTIYKSHLYVDLVAGYRTRHESRWISTYAGERLVGQPKFAVGFRYIDSGVSIGMWKPE